MADATMVISGQVEQEVFDIHFLFDIIESNELIIEADITDNYVEELMVLNDIINPYSIKEGQHIYFCNVNLLANLYTKDD